MYLSVVSMIVGQALILGDGALLEYGALAWLLFHAFVLIYEEPTLRASHPAGGVRAVMFSSVRCLVIRRLGSS